MIGTDFVDLGFPSMILAVVVSICVLGWAPSGSLDFLPSPSQSASQSSNWTQNAGSPQNTTPAPATAPSSAQQAPPSTAPSPTRTGKTAHRPQHKKAAANPGCANPPAAPSGATQDKPATAGANPSTQAEKPCPSPKIVVRHGGTSEPGVRLTGKPNTAQATYERTSTEQLLAATEENLKKTSGHTLSREQQEIVNQINQFMTQSRAAVAAGDTGRGHILAQKARLLSDELVSP
jgi:hypothetical protein